MIACIGETLEQREAGTTVQVVAAQTKAIAGTEVIQDWFPGARVHFWDINYNLLYSPYIWAALTQINIKSYNQ